MSITGNILRIWSDDPLWTKIIKLDQTYFPKPWDEKEWASLDPSHYYLAVCAKEVEVLAFVLLKVTTFDETAHLLKILVHPDRRGTNMTHELWSYIRKDLVKLNQTKVYLEVESSNARAIGFYEKAGFRVLRKIKAYYSDGTDGLTMELTL